MERVRTQEIGAHVGELVCLEGWLHRLRQLSNVSFLILRDGYGTSQIVLDQASQIALVESIPPEKSRTHRDGREMARITAGRALHRR